MPLWSAKRVVQALVETPVVETPEASDFNAEAYGLLMQDLAPHEAIRDLFEDRTRLSDAAKRLTGHGVTMEMLRVACGLVCGAIKCEPKHRRKVSQRAHFLCASNADILDVCPQMIATLLAPNVERHIEIATLLRDNSVGGDPASLLELDDFPTSLPAAMGISSERLYNAMILVIPPGAELYEYEYSSEASEEGAESAHVQQEAPRLEEQPSGSADGQQHPPGVEKTEEKKGHSSTSTVYDKHLIMRKRRKSE
jgi:hypothetical protein